MARRKALDGFFNEQDKWYADQPVGTIVHYDNGHNSFVRCKVVMGRDEGKRCKVLLPVALVGTWKGVPKWNIDGTPDYGYHGKKILNGETMRVSVTCIYESPFVAAGYREERLDPRKLEPISLQLPPLTSEQQVTARIWSCVYDLERIANRDRMQTPNLGKTNDEIGLAIIQMYRDRIAELDAAK